MHDRELLFWSVAFARRSFGLAFIDRFQSFLWTHRGSAHCKQALKPTEGVGAGLLGLQSSMCLRKVKNPLGEWPFISPAQFRVGGFHGDSHPVGF